MATILAGDSLSRSVLEALEVRAKGKNLALFVVQVGVNAVSRKYIAEKQKAAEKLGIAFSLTEIQGDVTQEDLEKKVQALASDPSCSGILVQLPLPAHLNTQKVLDMIPQEKDVDVLSTKSLELFREGKLGMLPPTVSAISLLLEASGVSLKDKQVVIVGKGRLVGMPLSLWFLQKGITPVVVDKSTLDIKEVIKKADILVSATGRAGLITGDMVKEGAVVVDAGTSVEGGDTRGDVDFGSVSKRASFITPVPGGVGPLTVACLFQNLVTLWEHS